MERQLSLEELGERVEVDAATLREIEEGRTSPSLSQALRIAAALDMTLVQLLGIAVLPDQRTLS